METDLGEMETSQAEKCVENELGKPTQTFEAQRTVDIYNADTQRAASKESKEQVVKPKIRPVKIPLELGAGVVQGDDGDYYFDAQSDKEDEKLDVDEELVKNIRMLYEAFLERMKLRNRNSEVAKNTCMYVPITVQPDKCNRHNHKNSGYKRRTRKRERKVILCFNCNEAGHFARNCPKPFRKTKGRTGSHKEDQKTVSQPKVCKEQNLSEQNDIKELKGELEQVKEALKELSKRLPVRAGEVRGGKGRKKNFICFTCKKMGHLKRECPRMTQGPGPQGDQSHSGN